MDRPNAWKGYTPDQLAELEEFCSAYADFLSANKTERACCASAVEAARARGYRDLDELVAAGTPLWPGDRVYAQTRGKTVMLVELGTAPLEQGLNILGAHIDSPRLDVKQNPLAESHEIATLDTHYYGGVKKYQWVATPLALHGVVVKKDGTTVQVAIGEKPGDPVLYISDLLPHLGSEQMAKKASEAIDGEMLDVLVGNRPLAVEASTDADPAAAEKPEKDQVKAAVLKLLADEYGIDEEDFMSAELEVVPAGPARDCGLDRSMIAGYGHDDRVCAYPSLMAQLACAKPVRTAVTLLVDKEEIGSVGATGMTSAFFENAMAEILALAGEGGDLPLRRCLARSRMLSSDVSAAYDPTFASVFEPKNACYLGHGVVFNKFTGSRGKSGSNDADAEYLAFIRRVMDEAGVCFQTAELGKVDAGGGGTIAYILAKYGMQVVDCGVAVLSMHAPWEVVSKADVYEAYRAYQAFLATE
jgi:aspartyl aminopeptidase